MFFPSSDARFRPPCRPPPLFPPPPAIRRAAVIGAGTMGAAIAAHLTNAGIPTLLLDQPAVDDGSPAGRDAFVQAGLERALRARPPAFMDPAKDECAADAR